MMKYTPQDIIVWLSKLISFFEPFYSLANSHLVSFFTENSWEKHIPNSIQTELNNLGSINEFIQLYTRIIKNNCPVEFAQRHPNLMSFVHTVLDISAANEKNFVTPLADVENLFFAEGCIYNEFSLKECMNPKKLYEVQVASKVTAALSNYIKSSHVVDLGSGKGYLGSVLALHHSLKVLGLDSSQVNTCGAVKISEKIAKLWGDEILKKEYSIPFEGTEKVNKKVREEFVQEYYKKVTAYVTPNTNVLKILAENFYENSEGITLTGLHTCGNLAPICLQMFLNNEDIRGLINVGCCYNVLTEKVSDCDFCEKVSGLKESECCGFPMSDFLNKKNFTLGQNARMLASHSLDRMKSNIDELAQISLLYRAILETVIKARGHSTKQKPIGRLAKKSKNFHEYVFQALKKLDINIMSERSKIIRKNLDEYPERSDFIDKNDRYLYMKIVTKNERTHSRTLQTNILFLKTKNAEPSLLYMGGFRFVLTKVKALKTFQKYLVTEDDLDKLYEFYVDKKPFLTAFFLIRVLLAPIIESIILLDRLLYLIENGVNNAYLVRLFDLEISPRGFGIIAWKDFDNSFTCLLNEARNKN